MTMRYELANSIMLCTVKLNRLEFKMSHFTVMVIGNNPEEQLAPYHEYESTENDDKYVVDVDITEETLSDYEVHKEDGQSLADFAEDWNGVVLRDGKIYRHTNPNSKWDWYSLGGRWSGLIKLKPKKVTMLSFTGEVELNKAGIDQAFKKDIANFDDLKTFALIKDSKWYERGEMGWWACVSNEKDEEKWDKEFKTLVESLPDDTLISIFDCHI